MLNILEDLKIKDFQRITGDASFRNFYRVIYKNKKSIFIYCTKNKKINLKKYIIINKFLNQNFLLAPKVFKINLKKNFIIIEDFGKKSYLNILKKKNKFNTYKKLVDEIIKIQSIPLKKSRIITGYYSKKILIKECDLFFKWYLPLIFKKKKIIFIQKEIKKLFYPLLKELSFSNQYFVHRDFHISNLISIKNKVGIIDSQDALIGNPTYDLLSLTDDVRIKTSNKLKTKLFHYYLSKADPIFKKKKSIFQKDFDILSVQRCLKIIGIFSRLCVRDKKNNYLRMLPYTWSLLFLRLKNPCFAKLKVFIEKYFPTKIVNKKIL